MLPRFLEAAWSAGRGRFLLGCAPVLQFNFACTLTCICNIAFEFLLDIADFDRVACAAACCCVPRLFAYAMLELASGSARAVLGCGARFGSFKLGYSNT